MAGAPFGSAHLRLREHLLDRATFCFPDSAFSPTHVATARHFDLMPLVEAHDRAVALDPDDEILDPLDGYIEAHMHGRVVLGEGVEAVVLDPAFRGTAVEERAGRLGFRWSGTRDGCSSCRPWLPTRTIGVRPRSPSVVRSPNTD